MHKQLLWVPKVLQAETALTKNKILRNVCAHSFYGHNPSIQILVSLFICMYYSLCYVYIIVL